jgi:hypothetical protein
VTAVSVLQRLLLHSSNNNRHNNWGTSEAKNAFDLPHLINGEAAKGFPITRQACIFMRHRVGHKMHGGQFLESAGVPAARRLSSLSP